MTLEDLEIFAKTIYGEARGEVYLRAKVMVGKVILNRARKGGWWGNTVREVCQKPYQFSVWNKTDPNYQVVNRPLEDLFGDPVFLECYGIAALLLSGRKGLPPDFAREPHTDAVTHYCTKELYEKNPPAWAKDRMHDFATGSHYFWSGIE